MYIHPNKHAGYYSIAVDEYDEYLAHYGVKGMKWGVRKDRTIGSRHTSWRNGENVDDDDEAWAMDIDVKKGIARGIAGAAVGVAITMATPSVAIFTIAGGLGSAAYTAAKFAANKHNDTKMEKERDAAPIDPKTGLHLKTAECSSEEDVSKVNPIRFGTVEGGSYNCSLCTAAFDMRRRGYDVAANLTADGTDHLIFEQWYKGAKMSATKHLNGEDKAEKVKNLTTELAKQGDGARGALTIMYSGGSGHAIAYEIVNGGVVIREAQGNKSYVLDEKMANKYFKYVDQANYVRLDNLEPNIENLRSALR